MSDKPNGSRLQLYVKEDSNDILISEQLNINISTSRDKLAVTAKDLGPNSAFIPSMRTVDVNIDFILDAATPNVNMVNYDYLADVELQGLTKVWTVKLEGLNEKQFIEFPAFISKLESFGLMEDKITCHMELTRGLLPS